MVAATYVGDIGASRAFYELLGFAEIRSGTAPASAWSELSSGSWQILLVSTQPVLELPELPLLFYFFTADLTAQLGELAAAGVRFDHLGHPEHAQGGEVKLSDPDGNTVLLGQRVASAATLAAAADQGTSRFSLLREAAATVAAHGGPGVRCQVSGKQWIPCGEAAEVRIADSAGDTVWACLAHADEILVSVPGAFLTSPGERGIAAYLTSRRR